MPPSHEIAESMHGAKPSLPSGRMIRCGGGQVRGTTWKPNTFSDSTRSAAVRPSRTTWYIGRISSAWKIGLNRNASRLTGSALSGAGLTISGVGSDVADGAVVGPGVVPGAGVVPGTSDPPGVTEAPGAAV